MPATYLRFSQDANLDMTARAPKLWGGKGAGLAHMCMMGLPVPPGFTISTDIFKAYKKHGTPVLDAIRKDLPDLIEHIANAYGGPCLLSVRSGARVSMPGMMDTILNVGMDDTNQEYWTKTLGVRAAWDCYRRFHEMYAETVLGVSKPQIETLKAMYGFEPTQGVQAHNEYCEAIRTHCENSGAYFPQTIEDQIMGAIQAVFDSWDNERAVTYRNLNNIPHDMGTAVTVQAMVFGNLDNISATGVCFTRNPSTGERGLVGEFLVNAQGEDVVAGTHTPNTFTSPQPGKVVTQLAYSPLDKRVIEALEHLTLLAAKIEAEKRDMQDIEFTIEHGKLWLLQTRAGKRSASAAFKIAQDLALEGVITPDEMAGRVNAADYFTAQRPRLNREATIKKLGQPVAHGLVGSTGVAIGTVMTAESFPANPDGNYILVAQDTSPNDIKAMAASVGILTATGGFTSHAAVVARGMNKVCITGADIGFTGATPYFLSKGKGSHFSGSVITICGDSGDVWLGEGVLEGGNAETPAEVVRQVMRAMGVRVRTETPAPGSYIVAAPWMERGELAVLIAKLLKDAPQDVILDLRPPVSWMDNEDSQFLRSVGQDARYTDLVSAALMQLANPGKSEFVCTLVIDQGYLPTAATAAGLQKYGFKFAKNCASLDEALAADAPITMSDSLKTLAGGDTGAEWLRKALTEKGVQFLDDHKTVSQGAATLLG